MEIAKSYLDFNSFKGVSSVFANTEKEQKFFEMMKPIIELENKIRRERGGKI